MRTPETQFLMTRCDREGRFTVRKIYHVPRVAVRILLVLLAKVKIAFSRTRDRRARSETFGIFAGTNIHVHPIPL
jgi:hypothetical protein